MTSSEQFKYFWNHRVRRIKIDSPPGFVVGCGYSGTSVTLAIVGTHSRIYAVPYESGIALQDNPEKFQEAVLSFERMAILDGKHRWIEKTPRHILHISQILKWRPDARILLILRDGRDVAWSIREQMGNVEDGIKRWVHDNLAARDYWQHPQVHVFRYEDLISDFESTVGGILEFLDEEYEEGMRNFHLIPRKWYAEEIYQPESRFGDNHKAFRNWQINQPLFDGRGRWKMLSESELSLVNDLGGDLLSELGYV